MTVTGRETPAWQQALGEALAEALPRLLQESADPLLQELIAALTACLCRGELALDLAGPAPAGVSAEAWPQGHRAALETSRLLLHPEGPLVLSGSQLAWRRWVERQQAVLAALLQRVEPDPGAADSASGMWLPGSGLGPALSSSAGSGGAAAPVPQAISATTTAIAAGTSSDKGSRPTFVAATAVVSDASLARCAQPEGDPVAADPLLQVLDPQQRRAVEAALAHRLVLILGGPGTGKTSTVAQLLAAVRRRQPQLRVQLAAPTGKAAARLRAATGGAEACSTLHRLLESRGEGFGRHRRRPLELDLLVIDELSMVDLELMEALLEALPAPCRLVLVGDPAQLPPIAPGAVLQALQAPDVAAALAPVRVELRTTYRNDGAIARVAAGLRDVIAADDSAQPQRGEPETAAAASALAAIRPLLLQLEQQDNLAWQQVSSRRLPAELLERLSRHQRRLAALAAVCWPDGDQGWTELMAERDRLLVLSPQRRGRWGIEAIHRALLGRAASAEGSGIADWPSGTPVLCRRNLPALGLANGDLGVLVVRPPDNAGREADRRILFGQEAPLWLHPAQLVGALEPALALTVHKAQGSEARELIVLLEDEVRAEARLLYTALTRAREQALLITAADPA